MCDDMTPKLLKVMCNYMTLKLPKLMTIMFTHVRLRFYSASIQAKYDK